MDALATAAALFSVGERGREDLPMVAAEALARGLDSPALIELACLYRTDTRDAADLPLQVGYELGLIDRSETTWEKRRIDLLFRRATDHADRLLAGDGDPLHHFDRLAAYLHELEHSHSTTGLAFPI